VSTYPATAAPSPYSTATEAATLNVDPVNDAPTAGDNTVTTLEDTPYIFTLADFNFADVDTGDILQSVTIETLPLGSLDLAGSGPVSALQVISRADILANNLIYTPTPDANGVAYASFDFTVSDGGLSSSPANTLTINVDADNDAPTATNLTQVQAYTEGDLLVALDDIVVGDIDINPVQTITATLTLANTAAGVLTTASGNGETYTAGTGVWTVTGTLASVNAALAAVGFVPATENDVDTTISTHVEDQDGVGPLDGSITLSVTAINDAPTATNLTQSKVYTEGAPSAALDDIVVTDVDSNPGQTITARLTLADISLGALSATSGNGEFYNPVTGVWQVIGTVANVNAALAAAEFLPVAENELTTTIATHVQDQNGTGPADGLITMSVNPVNDAPLATNLNQAKAYTEGDASVALDDIVVSDIDVNPTQIITAALVLTNPAAGALSTVSGNGENYSIATGVWTVTGNLFQVNAALAAVEFLPATDNDVDTTITTHIQDQGALGPTDGVITLSVTPVNDAPTATNLTQVKAYTEDDPTVALDDIVVGEVDTNPAQVITATLTLANIATGSLTAASGNGETYTAGTGIWTVTGSVANVNTALAAVSFTPAADNEVNTTITTHIEDQDGASPLNGSIALNVTPSNDPPTATNLVQVKAYNEGDATVALDDIVVSDIDLNPAQTITATLTLANTAAGSLTAASGNGEIYTAGTGIWTVTGTLASVNAALAAVAFTPATDNDVNTTISTHIEDQDGASPVDGSIALNVTPANDPPTATNLTQVKAYNEGDLTVALDDIVVSELDVNPAQAVTATLTLANTAAGALSATSGNGESYAAGTGIWTVTGTLASVNAALAGVAFTPATDNEVDTTITTHIEDQDAAGPADGSIALNVTPVNDAPTATNLTQAKLYNEGDGSVALDDIVVSDIDLNPAQTITATLTLANTAAGSLTAASGNGESYAAGTGIWTVTGTLVSVNAALASVAFSPATDNDVNTTITTHVEDQDGASPADGSVTLNVIPANDPPTATNLTQVKAYNEGDGTVALDDIVVSELDVNPAQAITATLTLANTAAGSLTDASGNGESYTAGTGIWTVTGTLASVNAALAAVAFGPATDNDVDTTITTHIEDQNATGPVDGSIALNVTPSNDPPTATNLNQIKAYNEGDGSVALDDIVVSEIDVNPAQTITATLTLANTAAGSLTAASGNGESYTAGTGIWTVTGTLASVNAALAAVAFTPATDNDVNTTISTHVEDQDGASSGWCEPG